MPDLDQSLQIACPYADQESYLNTWLLQEPGVMLGMGLLIGYLARWAQRWRR